jgi:hypothetical protein
MPYEAAAQQVMANEMLAQLHEGVGVTVKVAPDDAQSLMVWSVAGAVAPTAPSAGPAAPGTVAPAADRVARLTKLQSLRAAGAISDEEFAAQKARILAE